MKKQHKKLDNVKQQSTNCSNALYNHLNLKRFKFIFFMYKYKEERTYKQIYFLKTVKNILENILFCFQYISVIAFSYPKK